MCRIVEVEIRQSKITLACDQFVQTIRSRLPSTFFHCAQNVHSEVCCTFCVNPLGVQVGKSRLITQLLNRLWRFVVDYAAGASFPASPVRTHTWSISPGRVQVAVENYGRQFGDGGECLGRWWSWWVREGMQRFGLVVIFVLYVELYGKLLIIQSILYSGVWPRTV